MEQELNRPTNPIAIGSLKLRPVIDADKAFLLDVFASSREIELAMLPWDEAQKRAFVEQQLQAQTHYYESEYAAATHDIILYKNVEVGRIYVLRDEREIVILDMAVLHVHRKQGIATALIKQLQDEAGQAGKLVRVSIEPYNPSQNLFKNLGFNVSGNADDGVNLRFEWKA